MGDRYKPPQTCNQCNLADISDVLYWTGAFNSWNENGNKSYITDGLRLNRPIPPWAREFISEIIEGQAKRKPTLENIAIVRRNRFIKGNYQAILAQLKGAKKKGLLTGVSPGDLAITELTKIYNLKEETIRGIVRRKK